MGYLNELLSRNPLVIDGGTIRPHHNYTDDLYTGGNHKITNYDRIKSMSVEEMAEFNVTHDAENNMYLSLNGFLYGTKEVATEKNIQWLLQEVSENE